MPMDAASPCLKEKTKYSCIHRVVGAYVCVCALALYTVSYTYAPEMVHSGVARGGSGGSGPPLCAVGVCRERQWSAGSDCVALLPCRQDRWYSYPAVLCVCECGRQKRPHPFIYAHAHKRQAQQRKNFKAPPPFRNPGYAPGCMCSAFHWRCYFQYPFSSVSCMFSDKSDRFRWITDKL